MKFNKILLAIVFAASASLSFAQSKTLVLPNPTPPPGNIKLLPGYVHERKRGIDTAVGQISKKDGLVIRYDIGGLAGNYAASYYSREKQNLIWFKAQKINNQDVAIIYLKNGTICASFEASYANFTAVVKTNEELADFLLTIMTYSPAKKPE